MNFSNFAFKDRLCFHGSNVFSKEKNNNG